MKTYIVLRSNKEFGPFSIEVISQHGLMPADLIWVENESTGWQSATDLPDTAALAQHGIITPFVESFSQFELSAARSAENNLPQAHTPVDFHFTPPFNRPFQFVNFGNVANGFFGLAVLFIGLAFTAFIIQKLVSGFEINDSVAAQARAIDAEVITEKNSPHAAKATAPEIELPAKADSVTTTIVLARMPAKKVITIPSKTSTDVVTSEGQDVSEGNENKIIPAPESKPEVQPAVLRNSTLQLSANDYKVGLFGGVSNLEISVANPSSQTAAAATVEVEFMKPNGSVVKTQLLRVEAIAPGGIKKLTVPSSNRGVKIRYRVIDAEVKDTKLAVSNG